MRLLFSTVPALGHVLPLFPLARAAQDRGDTVAFLTSEGVREHIVADGFELLPVGPMMDELLAETTKRVDIDPAASTAPEVGAELFAGTRVDLTADESVEAAKAWQPDLIVSEFCDFVGPLVASALGIRWAFVSLGTAVPEFEAIMGATAKRHYAPRGLEPTPYSWFLDLCPPSLQPDGWVAPPQRIGLRPEAHSVRGYVPPAEVAKTRTRILVGFGTFFGKPEVLKPIVEGLAELDADIIVPLSSGGSPEDFGDLAERITFGPFRPLAELLPGTDLLVTHGGNGTAFAALALGIPVLTIPQGADQFIVADRLAERGVGLALQPDAVTPSAVADLAKQALESTEMRAGANRIAAEIAALPSPEAVAEQLA
ncbi:glycosyltransferase [Kibdelosporangium philippinense]|uniref:Glycosyltransferase n=1 Tax=Kibdelosporangium philippinense TaxID=211113 RepID=A0ABS8Z6S2_9PSEU|nr:glycosyltransferase [Kibdelosporangium philippinense]MCE7002336.1 glycosyltransferase [Kibdelosporangium philippinense]